MKRPARDSLEHHLGLIDRARLSSFLESLREPCHESALMRAAFGRVPSATPIALYRAHFALFHHLFTIQQAYADAGRYLHVHFMRTFLTDYPEPGRCRRYEPLSGVFCGDDAPDGYCPRHCPMVGDAELELLSERHFYLDGENYERLDDDTAEAFISGAWELLYGFADFVEAFTVLGIPQTGDADAVRKRFRLLARTHHPDAGGQAAAFNEINRAYRLVMRHIGAFDVFSS